MKNQWYSQFRVALSASFLPSLIMGRLFTSTSVSVAREGLLCHDKPHPPKTSLCYSGVRTTRHIYTLAPNIQTCPIVKSPQFKLAPNTNSPHFLCMVSTVRAYSRVDTHVLMEVAYSCNFLDVSDSSTCPGIGTSWCHTGIIEHFEIRGFKMTP